MFVTRLDLKNFRNYEAEGVDLSPGRNILIGDNAQGKTNFLEAIELVSNGQSDRARHDSELVRQQSDSMEIELLFQRRDRAESIHLHWRANNILRQGEEGALEKSIKINGVKYARMKQLHGHLATVSFKSSDVSLLRGGPKYRRDWVDHIVVNIKPGYHEHYAKYMKVVAQRNRLLKVLFEKGSVSSSAREELKVWDQQAAAYGAKIIMARLGVLTELCPLATEFQRSMSGAQESLSIGYQFKIDDKIDGDERDGALVEGPYNVSEGASMERPYKNQALKGGFIRVGEEGQLETEAVSEKEIESAMIGMFSKKRYEEISRRQTLFGPHRDDLSFALNQRDATAYASQGQQRSLILSLKLAELRLMTERLEETPILILDDVLAELDLSRQALLMSLVRGDMQTIISTTHLSDFRPEWLQDAQLLKVTNGRLTKINEGLERLLVT
jgi:DNA replication and repair protein RecF